MHVERVTCDSCSKDITYTGNCEDYRIVLCSESIPRYPDTCTATLMVAYPDFPKPLHFCRWQCFAKWCREKVLPVAPRGQDGE